MKKPRRRWDERKEWMMLALCLMTVGLSFWAIWTVNLVRRVASEIQAEYEARERLRKEAIPWPPEAKESSRKLR